MTGRKAVVGLSLLCALLFSAIAVQSASAAAGTNITAFTCVKEETKKFDFTDEHCDTKSAAKEGQFNHVAIPLKTATKVVTTNVTTGAATSPMVLAGKPFNVTTNITCTKAAGSGTTENSEPSEKVHKVTGSGSSEFTGCTASAPAKCTVKNPIIINIGSVESQEGLTGPKGEANAMGGELKAVAGKPFAEITLEGAECALKGKPFPVEGSVIATSGPGTAEPQTNKWSGATAVYTTEAGMSNLTAGGKAATFSGITTIRMEGAGGNPLTATTVT